MNRNTCSQWLLRLVSLLAVTVIVSVQAVAAPADARKKIVLIAGKKSHGPLGNRIHDYGWSVMLLKALLDQSSIREQVRTETHLDGWPQDERTLEDADTIVIISDGRDGPVGQEALHLASPARVAFMERLMKRGCGLVTFHFSTFAPEQYREQVLRWCGGYFQWETDGKRLWYSAIKVLDTDVTLPSLTHAIARGVKPFHLKEEFYYNLRFASGDARLTPLLSVPALPGREPDGRHVAWAVQREDGGRGFGTSCGHFYDNWKNDDFRKLMLNGIAWSARVELPPGGVESRYVERETFAPEAVKAQAAAMPAPAAPRLAITTKRPNVLFILTEDQGAQMGALGTAGIQTPHMDALARSGVLFRSAFVAYPVCSASKAAIYTSLHNHTNGLLNNTANFMKPASQLTEAEKNLNSYRTARIGASLPTLIERLHAGGWHQGVMGKLHVAPVEKFPYDEFTPVVNGKSMSAFIANAAKAGKPWHLFFNIGVSHRPFPNSDKVKIRVNPAEVKLPAFLPDTPVIRKDWSEYLAAIEAADRFVGEAMTALRQSGQEQNTIIVFMGDHGPCFAHGKMTMHDLGLRVPLIIRVPGGASGVVCDAPVSELDLAPTLLDLLKLESLPKSHGVSLRGIAEGKSNTRPHQFIFAEISDRGPLPSNGMQERSVFDGRWHLIARDKIETRWRQVQGDNKFWKTWGNRSYDETVRVKAQFPEAFRILAEMDPQSLGGEVPALELYDHQNDPDELHNLARNPAYRADLQRLHATLAKWCADTQDKSFTLPPLPRE